MIRIGVTGHRFLADIPKLRDGIDQALARIAQTYPSEPWAVVSSLAEGADRLAVHQVLGTRPEARLIVPLPLPIMDYLQDFGTAQSRAKFEELLAQAAEVIDPPEVTLRSEGYRLAGRKMLECSDVLIALWDGQDFSGAGRHGGNGGDCPPKRFASGLGEMRESKTGDWYRDQPERRAGKSEF